LPDTGPTPVTKAALAPSLYVMAAHPTVDLFLELQTALAGRYSLDRELGRGGMGIVYLAHDVDLDRLVAIKLLPPSLARTPAVRERFLREARTAARLSHPHIIPIYAVEQLDDFVFYVMGYVDGETLTQRVATRGPLTAGEGARVLREVSWALSYAHAQGIVHRDIKPDNILLDRESGHAVVADFGIAAAMGSTADVACGTPEFMSPEQALDRPVDARSDLYALGATAFFAFTGRPPFSGNNATEIIARHVADAAPLLSHAVMSVPRPLAQLVDRCLAKEPAQRPQSAQQVADALSSALEKRRELPAVLRAFVKRDGRMDGAGTMLTLFGALVGGVGISTVTSDLVGIGVMLGVAAAAPVVFSLSAARRLLRQGYRHGDLAPAFQSELETLREERTVSPRRAMRAVEWTLGRLVRVGASTTLVLTPFAVAGFVNRALDMVAPLTMGVGAITLLLTVCWLIALQTLRDVDVTFWRALWTGRAGRAAFAAARRLWRAAPAPAAMTHRATELSLGLAAEQLYESLPRAVRDELSDVPTVLELLQTSAEALRRRLAQVRETLQAAGASGEQDTAVLEDEEQRLIVRLRESVAALETLRLNLLRLHAGAISVESVTTNIVRAHDAAADVRRMSEAQEEVEDIFGAVVSAELPVHPSRPEWA